MMERRPAAAMRLRLFMQDGGVARCARRPGATLPMYCEEIPVGRAQRELFGDQAEALARLLERDPRIRSVIAVTDLGRARAMVRDFERWAGR